MKVQFHTCLLVIITALSACNKSAKNEDRLFYGKFRIRGHVTFANSFTGNGLPQKALNVDIYLNKDKRNIYSYDYKVKTDSALGQFEFQHLVKGHYVIYTEWKDAAGLQYSVSEEIDIKDEDVEKNLELELQKSGLLVKVVDSDGTSILTGARVCIFTSSQLAQQAGCDGSVDSKHTNSYGLCLFSDLRFNEPVWIKLTDTIAGIPFSQVQRVDVDSPFTAVTLVSGAAVQKGLLVKILDKQAGVIAGANVCIFTSKQLADSLGCEGSIITQPANAYGESWITGLRFGQDYWVKLHDTIAGIPLFDLERVRLDSPSTTVVLQPH